MCVLASINICVYIFTCKKQNPQSIKQLEELCKEKWGKVMLDQCRKPVANYRKQMEVVKQNRGYTKY